MGVGAQGAGATNPRLVEHRRESCCGKACDACFGADGAAEDYRCEEEAQGLSEVRDMVAALLPADAEDLVHRVELEAAASRPEPDDEAACKAEQKRGVSL